jgi:dephospho-CoA kinase
LKKLKIAITGSIGSGKSEFSKIVESYGFKVIRADDVSKQILNSNKIVEKKVKEIFGSDSYKNGKPDYKFLADIVFSNSEKLRLLEQILHPLVIKEIDKLSNEILKKDNVVFVESALVYEADLEHLFDYVVLITAPRDLRLQRKLGAGYTESDFIKRELNQIPDDEKKKRADFIFNNDKSLKELENFFKVLCLTLNIPI